MPLSYFMNWSSGKDAALALYYLSQSPDLRCQALLTSISSQYQRVSMHGLRRELLEAQAQALNLPLTIMELPQDASMEDYDRILKETVGNLKSEGAQASAFGDIFLEDLKRYREKQLETVGLQALFPLWKKDTTELIHRFVDLGFEAVVVCLNESKLPSEFLGRTIDLDFLKELPKDVDPCGENGEFHTFCYKGPIFKKPISFTLGEKTRRTYTNPKDSSQEIGYWFLDILLS
ncbi:MAG: diphthine--ammonia ligase [Flavobacteriaceae bacterium]